MNARTLYRNAVVLAAAVLLLSTISSSAQKIAGGIGHSLALCSDNTVKSWGMNTSGQLGNGTTGGNSNVPVPVSSLTGITIIAANWEHSLALKNDGTVWAWGNNSGGQLGNGTNTFSNVPVQVSNLTGIIAIAAGWAQSYAVKNDGTVWAWGTNDVGQLGNGTFINSNIPVQVTGLTGIIAVTAGAYHAIALKNDATAWAWGSNGWGELGDGSNNNSNIPVQVFNLSNVIAISGGNYVHSLALKNDGTVWAWGLNDLGQLGNGTNNNSNVPVQVSSLSNMIAIAGGNGHSLAAKSDGTVWAWGWNYHGQLGDGTNTSSNVPVQVSNLSGVLAVGSGRNHSLAMKNDGAVWTWGENGVGQLGDGTLESSNVPVQLTGLCQLGSIFYADNDADGYGDPNNSIQATTPPPGYVADNTDCNDAAASVHPGATEVCNGVDDDCDGLIDEGVTTIYYRDADGDGYGNATVTTQACSVPAGYVSNNSDCNDAIASIHPGATEVCNGIDDDCDGLIDDGVTTTYYRDADADGYGNATVTTQACTAPSGYIGNNTDCNDNNNAIHPGATEICANGIDDNCNGQIDENCPVIPLTISINDVSVYESQGIATLTVSLSKISAQAIKLNYQTVDGTASSRVVRKTLADYVAAKGSITIAAGSLTGTISITVINDGQAESTEYFDVQLSFPKGTTGTFTKSRGRTTILDGTPPTVGNKAGKTIRPEITVIQELKTRVLSNPTSYYFTINTESSNHQPLIVRVSDEHGRLIEIRNNVPPNSTWRIGNNYGNGFYIMEIIQGDARKTIKLLKL